MRAWHLLSLRAASAFSLRYHRQSVEPLFLPCWLPKTDREILLAFYGQILGESPIHRVEVDWYRSLLRADRTFLETTLRHHGATAHLAVVKIRGEGVDLLEVLRQPVLRSFEYLAIAADVPVKNDHLGELLQLAGFVRERMEELYEELTIELDLRSDGLSLVSSLLSSLINPITILETFNALVDVQAEELSPEMHQDAILQRVVGRLLDELPGEELVALAGTLTGWPAQLTDCLGDARKTAEDALRNRELLLNGRLTRWARWLEDEKLHEVLLRRLDLAGTSRITQGAAEAATVLRPFRATMPLPSSVTKHADEIRSRIRRATQQLDKGFIAQAEEELVAIEREIDNPEIQGKILEKYWGVVGVLRQKQGRLEDSEQAFGKSLSFGFGTTSSSEDFSLEDLITLRDALVLNEGEGAFHSTRSIMMFELAKTLKNEGKWNDAEPLLVEAMRLQKKGSGDPLSLANTMRELAIGRRDDGRWDEAEPLFREVLRLQAYGGADSFSIARTVDELARGLRANGREHEAEELLRTKTPVETPTPHDGS